MGVLDRYLGALEELERRIAVECLGHVPENEKTEFGFGKAVGTLQGIRLAKDEFERLLNEAEKDPDRGYESKSRRRT